MTSTCLASCVTLVNCSSSCSQLRLETTFSEQGTFQFQQKSRQTSRCCGKRINSLLTLLRKSTAGQSGVILPNRESIFSQTNTKIVSRKLFIRTSALRGVRSIANRSVCIWGGGFPAPGTVANGAQRLQALFPNSTSAPSSPTRSRNGMVIVLQALSKRVAECHSLRSSRWAGG